ncbi:MAG: hypothetical protein NVS3B10_09500 [Polyangiales bacterium]
MQYIASGRKPRLAPSAKRPSPRSSRAWARRLRPGCHLFEEGRGDDSDEGLAPELAGWGSKAWIRAQIANPASGASYRKPALDADRDGHMPRFDRELHAEDLDLLATWLYAQTRRP